MSRSPYSFPPRRIDPPKPSLYEARCNLLLEQAAIYQRRRWWTLFLLGMACFGGALGCIGGILASL